MEWREWDIKKECENTCEWLLKHEKYRTWEKQSHGLLWIMGSPGTGKSTLVKYALNRERSNGKYAVASFFFHGRGSELQKTPLGLWRTIVLQLLYQITDLLPKFRLAFERKLKAQEQQGMTWVWHQNELKEFFETHVAELHPVKIFIDALDECGETVAQELVEYFQSLVSCSKSTLSICFSCRYYPTIGDSLSPATIRVDEENQNDISTFVETELSGSINQQNKLKKIQEEISSRASGSFQWANIVGSRARRSFEKGTAMRQIMTELLKTPDELNGVYSEVIETIDSDARDQASHLLQWLCLGARPLSLTELRFAMASDWPYNSGRPYQLHEELENSDDYDDDDQMERLVRHLSGGLAEIKSQGEDRIVQLIHESVNEFLTSKGLESLATSLQDGHSRLSRACINYVTLDDICEKVRANEIQELPFLGYAVTYWGFHVEKAISVADPPNSLSSSFTWPPDDMLQRWMEVYRLINDVDQATLLHYTSEHGLLNSVKYLLLEKNAQINSMDEGGQTPLSYAAQNGHEEVVQELIEKGADVASGSSLWYAIMNGHAGVVERLLRSDVDHQVLQEDIRTSLWYAARNGYEGAVRVLLKNGVDANLTDGYNRALLWHAAGKGHTELVKLLLGHGAKIDLKDKDCRTPLSLASDNGYDEVVGLLLENHADANSGDIFGRTPLSLAADNGHDRVVSLLLRENVVVDSRDGRGRTPLWYGALNGHERVVTLLLEKGADAESPDNVGFTPLHWAQDNGHEVLVRLMQKKDGEKVDLQVE